MPEHREGGFQPIGAKAVTPLPHDRLPGTGRYKISYSAPIVDKGALGEHLVGAHHGVGVNLHLRGVFPHRRQPLFLGIFTRCDSIGDCIGYLQIS